MNLEQFLMIKRANTGQIVRMANKLRPAAQEAVNTFNPESIRRWSDALAKAGPYNPKLAGPPLPRLRGTRGPVASGIQTAKPGDQVYVPAGSQIRTLWGPAPTPVSVAPGIGAPLGINYRW